MRKRKPLPTGITYRIQKLPSDPLKKGIILGRLDLHKRSVPEKRVKDTVVTLKHLEEIEQKLHNRKLGAQEYVNALLKLRKMGWTKGRVIETAKEIIRESGNMKLVGMALSEGIISEQEARRIITQINGKPEYKGHRRKSGDPRATKIARTKVGAGVRFGSKGERIVTEHEMFRKRTKKEWEEYKRAIEDFAAQEREAKEKAAGKKPIKPAKQSVTIQTVEKWMLEEGLGEQKVITRLRKMQKEKKISAETVHDLNRRITNTSFRKSFAKKRQRYLESQRSKGN